MTTDRSLAWIAKTGLSKNEQSNNTMRRTKTKSIGLQLETHATKFGTGTKPTVRQDISSYLQNMRQLTQKIQSKTKADVPVSQKVVKIQKPAEPQVKKGIDVVIKPKGSIFDKLDQVNFDTLSDLDDISVPSELDEEESAMVSVQPPTKPVKTTEKPGKKQSGTKLAAQQRDDNDDSLNESISSILNVKSLSDLESIADEEEVDSVATETISTIRQVSSIKQLPDLLKEPMERSANRKETVKSQCKVAENAKIESRKPQLKSSKLLTPHKSESSIASEIKTDDTISIISSHLDSPLSPQLLSPIKTSVHDQSPDVYEADFEDEEKEEFSDSESETLTMTSSSYDDPTVIEQSPSKITSPDKSLIRSDEHVQQIEPPVKYDEKHANLSPKNILGKNESCQTEFRPFQTDSSARIELNTAMLAGPMALMNYADAMDKQSPMNKMVRKMLVAQLDTLQFAADTQYALMQHRFQTMHKK